MAIALALLVATLAGAPAAAQTEPGPRIIGGSTVPAGKYPFVAALETGGSAFCGGSVVSSKWVMTAAHCVTNSAGAIDLLAADLDVVIGRYDLTGTDGEVIVAADIVVHPMWDGDSDGTFEYDLALIELSSATTATPVDLATPADAGLWDPGDSATVMGWGWTNPGSGPASNTLQEVDIPVVADAVCSTVWGSFFNPLVELCGGDDTVDSCVGDSGGPLVAPPGGSGWKQIGVVSSGPLPCAQSAFPGIYAQVAALRAFVDNPMAVDDAYSLLEEGTLTTTAGVDGVADNDKDVADGTPPGGAVTLVTPPASHDGTFTLDADGSFTYDPVADFFGGDSFTYTVSDSEGNPSSVTTVTITVDPVNDEPSFTKGSDQIVPVGSGPQTVPGWATDISPGAANESTQVLTFNVTGNTNPGLFAAGPIVTGAGTLSYTPAASIDGSADITIDVMDDGGTANGGDDRSPPQSFQITVTVNMPPTAVADAYTVLEDVLFVTNAATGVAANDTDPEDGTPPGGNVSLAGSPPPNQLPGGFVLDPNGAFTYRPPLNQNGPFTFMYTIEDSGGAPSNPATVTLNVLPVNDRPTFTVGPNQSVVEDAGAQTVPGWATSMSPGPSNEAGQTLTFVVAGNTKPPLFAAGPAVDAASGDLTFTPAPDAHGTATITLQLKDDGGTANGGKDTSVDRQFTITVTPVEDSPFAVPDSYTIAEDTTLTVVAPGVAGNDTDPEDGTPPKGAVTAVGLPGNAQTFSLSSNGSLTYRGNPDFNGADSFTYTITDSAGKVSGLATVAITVSPVNDPPVAVADGPYTVAEAGSVTGNVLANDVDVDGDPLTAELVSNPLNGVVRLAADGSFTYIHGGSETVSDSFTYKAFDGTALSASVTVPITVTPVNDRPVAVDDGPITFDASGVTAISVLRNDSDAEGSPLTITIVSPPSRGTAVVTGNFVMYTPDSSLVASDSFTYVASDGMADSNVATVTLTTVVGAGDAVGLVDPTQGRWHLRGPAGAVSFFYGNPGDVPFVGDWDCDGVDTPGLYRQSDGFVYLRNSNTSGVADVRFFFGDPGDIPLAGDWDGDGCDTVSLYRPDLQRFFIINELGESDGGLGSADFAFTFGDPGDQPFAGDLDGDGITEVGLHRASTGLIYYRTTLTWGPADRTFVFGDPGDRLYAGDWTGLGAESVGLFRPSNTTHYLRHTNTAGNADQTIVQGESNWLPVAGRFG